MSNFIQAVKTDELADGTMREVLVQGYEILLVRAGDKYYAADNRCPHMRGNLSQGKFEGTIVTCLRHGSQFDLRDGQVVRWLKGSDLISKLFKAFQPPRPLTIYNVKVEDDRVLIEI